MFNFQKKYEPNKSIYDNYYNFVQPMFDACKKYNDHDLASVFPECNLAYNNLTNYRNAVIIDYKKYLVTLECTLQNIKSVKPFIEK
ncbi:hypothetical protein BH10BAC5_BH10BAC5_00010 [soil metagenome]